MDVSAVVSDFILENFLFKDASRLPAKDVSLIESGVIDSTGILELIEFIESKFEIHVNDTEIFPQNLGSIDNITRFVKAKTSQSN